MPAHLRVYMFQVSTCATGFAFPAGLGGSVLHRRRQDTDGERFHGKRARAFSSGDNPGETFAADARRQRRQSLVCNPAIFIRAEGAYQPPAPLQVPPPATRQAHIPSALTGTTADEGVSTQRTDRGVFILTREALPHQDARNKAQYRRTSMFCAYAPREQYFAGRLHRPFAEIIEKTVAPE